MIFRCYTLSAERIDVRGLPFPSHGPQFEVALHVGHHALREVADSKLGTGSGG